MMQWRTMRLVGFSLALISSLVLAGCGAAGEDGAATVDPPVDPASEREALMQADRDFARAFAERGVEGWVSFFDEKGVQMPGGMPTAWGREEVEATSRQLYETPNFTGLSWEPAYAVVAEAGDLGYTLGDYVAEGLDAEGETVTQQGNYVTIWRNQEDGSWKVLFDTGNAGPPLQVPTDWP